MCTRHAKSVCRDTASQSHYTAKSQELPISPIAAFARSQVSADAALERHHRNISDAASSYHRSSDRYYESSGVSYSGYQNNMIAQNNHVVKNKLSEMESHSRMNIGIDYARYFQQNSYSYGHGYPYYQTQHPNPFGRDSNSEQHSQGEPPRYYYSH